MSQRAPSVLHVYPPKVDIPSDAYRVLIEPLSFQNSNGV